MSDQNLAKQLAKQEIDPTVKAAREDAKAAPATKREKQATFKRTVVALGLGDGGCKIASDTSKLPDVYAMGYNLSKRNENLFNLKKFISADAQDGSGKNRGYAKEIVGRPEVMDTIIQETLSVKSDIIIIEQSTGGGTGCGSGPKVAISIADAIIDAGVRADADKPVIVLGVYPKLSDDSVSIFNTLTWQKEVKTIELPYMVFNNARVDSPSPLTHEKVNDEIVDAVHVISGGSFQQSDVYSMDSKDFFNILNRPGRLNVYYTDQRPKMNESLDNFLMNLIQNSTQEAPLYPEAYALLVKGPKDVIASIDDSLSSFNATYGEALLKYKHIEEGTSVEIAFITSGSQAPKTALDRLQSRYDEIEYSRRNKEEIKVEFDIDDPFSKRERTKKGGLI